MKLTIIGFWGAYPKVNEATSCFLVEDGGATKILLDCGSGAVAQLQNYVKLNEIDAVVLSHYHADHVADIGVLTYSRVVDINLNRTEKPLMIYGHDQDKPSFEKLAKPPFTDVKKYDVQAEVKIGSLTIQFLETSHPVPCFAMKISSDRTDKTIVYTADSTFFQELIPFAAGASLLIAETSFYAGEPAKNYGHMNSDEVATLAKESGVEELLLTHLPHFGKHQRLLDEVKSRFAGKVSLAKTGESWEL